ncbi:MAG: M48 family metallopeptidase [Candidatus Tisiphia sp.]
MFFTLTTQKYFSKVFKRYVVLETTKLATILAKEHNINFTKIKIMNNKGKWGSCSSKAVLAFNWRLIFAPKKILKYLVTHEICHIIEMNHSPGLSERLCKYDVRVSPSLIDICPFLDQYHKVWQIDSRQLTNL